MSRKAIIILVIVVVVIIIGVVGFLIYKKSKDKKAEQAAKDAALLQAQLNANPNMPQQQKAGILEQLAMLAEQIRAAKGGDQGQPNPYPQGFPGLGGPWNPNPSGPGTPVAAYGFPLKTGSSGNYVANLQNAINKTCNTKLVPDGKFGPLTANAAKSCFGSPVVSWELYRSYGLA